MNNRDLISREPVLKETEAIIRFREQHHLDTKEYEVFLQYIKERPAVDAVEVVRCRDCKYLFEDNFDGSLWCCHGGEREVVERHFCSYGERKE